MSVHTTAARDRARCATAATFELVVIADGQLTVHRLPDRGEITVGRGETCDVRIEHPAVSRRHARLQIGPLLAIEDLGSCNGTRLRGLPLPPHHAVSLAPGELVSLDTVMAVVHEGAEEAPREEASPPEQGSMVRLLQLVDRIAASAINVLVLGETGAGKEVLAERIHRASPRAGAPFLRLHCAALAESLLESELFGHERGAFTGAVAVKPGLLETADGGTVLLDEIGELPMSIQVKLLRVLEERKVLRVGGLKGRPIDVRFVAATNRDLAAEVRRGAFRQDLFYRLNGISFVVPPLRERLDEVAPLARVLIDAFWAQHGRSTPAPGLTACALAALHEHPWPGNIRELRNVLERAVFLSGGGPITPAHLPDELAALAPAGWQAEVALVESPRPVRVEASPPPRDGAGTLDPDEPERQRILAALAECAGNQTRAAVRLGLSRRTLVTRLGSLKLPRPRAPTGDD